MNSFYRLLAVFAGVVLATDSHALGFELGKTKEELGLKYELTVSEHKTERVSIRFVLQDAGKMAPLTSVDLSIPSDDGSGYFHLVVPIQLSESGDAKSARIHIHRDWLKNATISLKTRTLDGKQSPETWYYHLIPLTQPDDK